MAAKSAQASSDHWNTMDVNVKSPVQTEPTQNPPTSPSQKQKPKPDGTKKSEQKPSKELH